MQYGFVLSELLDLKNVLTCRLALGSRPGMPSQGVFALALHFPVLEGLKNLLEKGRQLSNGRHSKIAFRGTLLPPFFVYH